MYTQIDNQVALTTHLQDERFEYVVLYFYMAPLPCCVDTLNAIKEVSRNPRTHAVSFLAIDLNAPGLADINASFGVTKVPELSVRGINEGKITRLTICTSSDVSSALRRYCGIDLNTP
jgi:hypothetical protein